MKIKYCKYFFYSIYLVMSLSLFQAGCAGSSFADADGHHGYHGEREKLTQYGEKEKRKMQDEVSGIPQSVLAKQSNSAVKVLSVNETIQIAQEAAKEIALPLIDENFHKYGTKITVPNDYKTIQAAINAASYGDLIVVKPGTYYELLVMKDGVKLVSDSADNGNELVSVEGAKLKLPRRTLRTIIDGSKGKPSRHGMFDFDAGLGRKTIIDGFTIQNLPVQNHHIPRHAHGLNIRGAKPVITNCLIRNNGSTGIGSHVIFNDQGTPIDERDFRWANIKHRSSAVIYNNIVYGNLGLGIGSNHFSDPYILGNEVFNNDDSDLGEAPSPGIGNKHGSAATIIGNIVHDNPGGGITCGKGVDQGAYPIDKPTHPRIVKNVVLNNGTIRSGITCYSAGSEETPVNFIGNYVYDSGKSGIGLTDGTVAIIEENMVSGSKLAGISLIDATALKLNHNMVTGAKEGAGISIMDGAVVHEMVGNSSDSNQGIRFKLKDGTIIR